MTIPVINRVKNVILRWLRRYSRSLGKPVWETPITSPAEATDPPTILHTQKEWKPADVVRFQWFTTKDVKVGNFEQLLKAAAAGTISGGKIYFDTGSHVAYTLEEIHVVTPADWTQG